MWDFLTHLFNTDGYPPRWNCGDWTAGHGWLHILSDLAIWSAYFAIPCILAYFVLRRRDVPFPTLFWLFGAFILACGTTHLMEAIIFWHPVYRLAGLVKLFTAIVSWGTVVALAPIIPKALAMRSPDELEREIARRKEAETALHRSNAELESRVRDRTAELAGLNASLRFEREMLRITLASIGDAVIATDVEGRVTFLNPVAQGLTGWSEEEAKEQPLGRVYQIVNERTRTIVENPAMRALKEGIIVGLANHTILIAKDGTERPIDDSAAPIRHESGKVAGVVLVFRDVTDQRKAQQSARMLASIVESSDDAIISKDVNGLITSWNRGAERMFGYTADEVVGHPIAVLAPPERPDEMPSILTRIRNGERVGHFDTVRRAKDGRLVPISLTVSPVKDDEGQVVGASKIARDISERLRAEESLRAEKARLHATLTGIGDAVIVTDAEGRITLLNPVACALTGWEKGATGRPLDEVFCIVNEQTRQPVESPVRRVLREGVIVGLANHTVLLAKDGTERPIDDSAAPIRDQNGQIVGVVMVFRDVTVRRQTEEALRRLTEQLHIVTDGMAAPVARCGRDLTYQWVSKGYAAWIGLSAEQVVGRPIVDIIGPEAFDQLRPHFERVLAGQVVRYEELVHFRGIGPRWVSAIYTPTLDRGGVPDGWVGVVLDITERRQMEEALRQSEQRFRQLAENVNEVFWMTDPHTTQLLYISPAYERVWGRSCQSLYDNPRSFMDAIHPEDQERVRIAVLENQSRGEQTDKEYRVVRPDGSIRWVRDRAFPVRNAAGRFYRLVGIIEDFTERKAAEEALKEADRRKDEFLATLGHELRNPLAPIRNAVQILRLSELPDPQLRQVRDIIDRQVQHMARLIDDLLDVSRITKGRLHLRKERVELAAVVRSALEVTNPLLEARAHAFTLTLPPEPVFVDADPTRLSQVIANLLSNAAKYTDNRGHIWLTVERQDSEAVVSVRDTGIGIAPEHLPYLFDTFSQVAPALERSQGGLGIGLALVRRLVELHGGRVEARSGGLGLGSEFVVRLRAIEALAQQRQEPPGSLDKSRRGKKLRILVADDLPDSANSLAMMLRMDGHDIQTTYDGQQAVRAAAMLRPDVALLDIGMPKMNGHEAARHIREQPWGKDMVLVALTGWGQEEDKRRALEAGFNYHLTKPVEAEALENLLALINPAVQP